MYIVFIPKSPEGHILKYEALLNEITYQVRVTDEDQALIEGSLKVSVENQMESYDVSIPLGETAGYFENLKPNTQYRLSIYGDKGYGIERLDSVVVQTKQQEGGYILGYVPITTGQEPWYHVEVLINDPDQKFESVMLYYGYRIDDEPYYQSIPITQSREIVELAYIFNQTHVYLEAQTVEGLVILDELWITPPFQLHSSLYLDRIDSNEIDIGLYHDMQMNVDVTYFIEIYENETLRQTQSINSNQILGHQQIITISSLRPLTFYKMIAHATYISPTTKVEESVSLLEQEFTTLGEYNVSYQVIKNEFTFDVDMTVIDPSHYFQIPYYELYDISQEYPVMISSMSYSFIPDLNSKSVQFVIDIPDISRYRLVVGIRNQNNYMIRHLIYDEIHTKE